VGQRFKEVNPDCIVVAMEPGESCTILCGEIGKHLIEGIADGFVPGIIERHRKELDRVVSVDSESAITEMHRLAREHGVFVGPSSGAHLVAARDLKKELGVEHVVTFLCDEGEKYLQDYFLGDPTDGHLDSSPRAQLILSISVPYSAQRCVGRNAAWSRSWSHGHRSDERTGGGDRGGHRGQQPRLPPGPPRLARHRADRQGAPAQPRRVDGHASNFIFPVDHSREMTDLTADSMRQYKELGCSPSPAATRSHARRSGCRSSTGGCSRRRRGASTPSWSRRSTWSRRFPSSIPR
jgi:hypothetical protein